MKSSSSSSSSSDASGLDSSLSSSRNRRSNHNKNGGTGGNAGDDDFATTGGNVTRGGSVGGGGGGGPVHRTLLFSLMVSVLFLLYSNVGGGGGAAAVGVGGGVDAANKDGGDDGNNDKNNTKKNSGVINAVDEVAATARAAAPATIGVAVDNAVDAESFPRSTTTTTKKTTTKKTTTTEEETAEGQNDEDDGDGDESISETRSEKSKKSSSSSPKTFSLTCQDYNYDPDEEEQQQDVGAGLTALAPKFKTTSVNPISQADARRIITGYIRETGTTPKSKSITGWNAKGGKPTLFNIVMTELVKYAQSREDDPKTMISFQLGGMDGKTNDPMYGMSENFERLGSSWLPVVIEPVPLNYKNLVETYRRHQAGKGLECSFLYEQIITYEARNGQKTNHNDTVQIADRPGKCWFCRYDIDNPDCQKKPEWWKHQIASVECHSRMAWGCFLKESYDCSTIGEVLTEKSDGLRYEHVSVLQVDVEGYEHIVFTGMFDEIERRHLERKAAKRRDDGDDQDQDQDDQDDDDYPYPPVIHFESKVIKKRKNLRPVMKMLSDRGYTMYQQGLDDTLALRLLPTATPPPPPPPAKASEAATSSK